MVKKAGAIAYSTARRENVSVSGGILILAALHDNYVDSSGVSHP